MNNICAMGTLGLPLMSTKPWRRRNKQKEEGLDVTAKRQNLFYSKVHYTIWFLNQNYLIKCKKRYPKNRKRTGKISRRKSLSSKIICLCSKSFFFN